MTRKLLGIMYCESTAVVHAGRKCKNMGMVLFHNKYLRKGNIQIRQAKSYTKNLAEAGLYMDT